MGRASKTKTAAAISGVTECDLPDGSRIGVCSVGADFWDAYMTPNPQPDADPLETWLDLVALTPSWVDALMALRNRAVQWVGLKGLGSLAGASLTERRVRPVADWQVGDRVGIFEIRNRSATEVVLGQDDRHLDVSVALCKVSSPQGPMLVVGTVVHIHNALGVGYMAVIKPFHRHIVKTMMARVARLTPSSRNDHARAQAERLSTGPGA